MKSKRARGTPRLRLISERRLRLASGRHLRPATARRGPVLTSPAGPVQLNDTAAAILALCDGSRTREEVVSAALASRDADLADDVRAFLAAARRRGWLVED